MIINQLRPNPVLTTRVSAEIDQLGLSSSELEDGCRVQHKETLPQGRKLSSGKTAKLTSRVIVPQ